MTNVNYLIKIVPATMHKVTYKGRNRWARTHKLAIAWVAKQIMLDEIYPKDGGGERGEDHFEYWDEIKGKTIAILNSQGVEAAEEFVRHYWEEEYIPPDPELKNERPYDANREMFPNEWL
jgi:hypothetical protein